MPKSKRLNKTREQLLAELKGNQKFQEKMKFTREMFYPALVKASVSIDDAQQLLYMINTMVMEKFLGLMREKTFKDLAMEDKLNPKDPQYSNIKSLLDLFADMTVFDAKDLIEGMRNEINLFINEENKTRTLDQLKVKWIDE